MLTVLIAAVAVVILAFGMFSLRLLFVKNGEFRGTCASNSPYLNKEGVVCGVCGRQPGEACANNDLPEVTSSQTRG